MKIEDCQSLCVLYIFIHLNLKNKSSKSFVTFVVETNQNQN